MLEVRQQGGPVVGADAFVRQVRGEEVHVGGDGGRPGQEVCGHDAGRQRAIAPHDLVEQLVDPLHRREERRPRGPLYGEAGQLPDERPVRRVEPQVRGVDLGHVAGLILSVGPALPHGHMADQPVRKPVAQPEPLPREGQIGDPFLAAVRVARRAEDLEAAVQHERMRVVGAALEPGRERDLGDGLALPRPERVDRAEGWAEIDPDRGLGAVVGGEVHRRERGLHSLDVERGGSLRGAGRACRDPPFRVQGPAVFAIAPAEDADAPRRAVVILVQQQLHAPAPVGGAVFGILVGKDQRALHPKVFDADCAAPLGAAGRRRHCAVERARRDQPAEDAMVGEPRRIGGEDLGVEGDLPARGFVARAQQGVAGVGAPPPGRLDPVALALERVAGERDPAALLAGEEPVEAERKMRLVGAGDRLHEAAAGTRRRLRLVLRRPLQAAENCRGGSRRLRPGHGRHRTQHRMGADLDDGIHAEFRQRLDAGPEGHRLARLAPPVRRIGCLARFQRPAGQVADEGERGRREGDRRDRGLQIAERGLDHGAVVGRAPAQPCDADILRLEAREQRLHIRLGAAHHLVGAVVRRDAEARPVRCRIVRRHGVRHAGGRREDCRHRALAGERPDQAPPRRCEAKPLLQAEDAGGVRGRDLAQAVPEHHVRPDAEALPERRERALQRVDRGLLPLRIVQLVRRAGPAEHHVQQRGAAALRRQQRIAAVEHGAERRLARIESPAHARPLAGLPGVGERDPGSRPRRRALVPLRQRRQARPQRVRVVERQARAMAEMAAARSGRPCHVGERLRVGALVEPRQIVAGQRPQRRIRLARER